MRNLLLLYLWFAVYLGKNRSIAAAYLKENVKKDESSFVQRPRNETGAGVREVCLDNIEDQLIKSA